MTCFLQVCYNLFMAQEKKDVCRSNCPVSSAVEIFGDKWSLLIVRDIIFFGKKTFGEFFRSDEKIATNILSNRLQSLESAGILSKCAHPDDKRKDVYALTEKGRELIPVVLEIFNWGLAHNPSPSAQNGSAEQRVVEKFVKQFQRNRQKTIEEVKDTIQGGGFIFSNE